MGHRPEGGAEDLDVEVGRAGFGFGETGVLFVAPSIRTCGEDGASSSDSQTYGLLAAAFWQINPDLRLGPGLGVFSRLEDSARVFPILAIDWNFGERWNLSTGRGLAASQGPGLTLSYELTSNWSLALAGRYEEVEFRLDKDGPNPGGIAIVKLLGSPQVYACS